MLFSGYDTTELVAAADVKPLSDTKKRALEVSEQDLEKEKRRKKMEKKKETREVKTEEQGSRQKSWQSFAKKVSLSLFPSCLHRVLIFACLLCEQSTKKGVHIPGIAGDSMFKSPEDLNPNARGTVFLPPPSILSLSRYGLVFMSLSFLLRGTREQRRPR